MDTYAINPYFEERILGGDAPMTPTSNAGDVDVQKGVERKLAESTLSEEREDLKEAAEHSNNVILHLNLDGTVRWVSSSWEDVIGHPREEIVDKPISTIVPDDETMFERAVHTMTTDDSRSFRLRFSVLMGPKSRVAESLPEAINEIEIEVADGKKEVEQRLNLEAQGILIYDRDTGETSHTMWVIRPFISFATVTVNLPSVLVESLGVGATILAQYIKSLAEGLNDPANNPPPVPVLCRICERQIPPWWFEKHSELCFLEHKAESEVQLCQENLGIHRSVIVKILDAMERQTSRVPGGAASEGTRSPSIVPEYRGHPIGPQPSPSAGINNSPHTPPRSRESSASGSNFRSSRDFRVRRPQVRIVELLLDLCDTAMEISTPMIKEALGSVEIGFRTQSPASEARITQVLQWQSPSNNTLDQERGLALLCEDTEGVAKAKVEAVIRHRHTIEFSERIRLEFSMLVQDCIDEAVRTAALTREGLVEGEQSDSEGEEEEEDETQFFPGSFGPHIPQHLRESSQDPSMRGRLRRHSSPVEHSSASVSPGDCTPRSQRSRVRGLQRQHSHRYANRSSAYFDNDGGDQSDTSGKSSLLAASNIPRTESPLSDVDASQSRLIISKDKKRSSIYQPRSRQASPARGGIPISSSPLRILKPRITSLYDTVPTPVTSPLLSTGDFSPALENYHHHRRQSSVASNDQLPRPPLSPRLPQVNPSQPRAVPPSIKDFEIIKPISKGAFGSVYLSKKKSTGDYYAIKVLKKADMIAKNQVTNVRAERAIMMVQGESDFVAKLFWTFSSKDYLFLVMEYLNGGDCAALIKALGGLPEEWSKRYLAEVILGLEHLHSRGIVHRDLKPDNLLIDGNGHLKLTDFGLSRMGLLGRQKRVREQTTESTPDLLSQGPFLTRSKSVASSRSTSFDFPGSSPSSTPLITPNPGEQLIAPSYFSLSRDSTSSRRASNPRSEPNVDGLTSMMGSFNMSDLGSGYGTPGAFRRQFDDDCQSEVSYGSNEATGLGLHQVTSNASGSQAASVSQQQMMPPPMALFDPEDSNRKFVGTPDYLAPETIRGSGQDEMSDWWSLGCIMFEFLYGYPPFNADSHDQVFENILNRRINWPDDEDCPVSPEAKDLMNRLMCTDQTQRLGANGAEEVKEHPWFADVKWESVLQEQPSFVPNPAHVEDTDYFDSRGATLTNLEEFEDQGQPSPALTPGADYADRPHDAVPRQKSSGLSKRGLVPLHIPPHVREGNRNRRLSEPMGADDFGNFAFKNLPVLEKANKDVIQRLRTEAMKNPALSQSIPNTPTSSDGSPTVSQKPLGRALSNASSKNGGNKRPSSPSSLNTAPTSGSSRGSQPSSPLLVTFNTTDKRKTSNGSATSAPSSAFSPIMGHSALIDIPRLSTAAHGSAISSTSTSPIKIQSKTSASVPASSLSTSPILTQNNKQIASPPSISPSGSTLLQRRTTLPGRPRSTTVGSEGDKVPILDTLKRQNRRSQVFDMSPSSSDNEDARNSALLRVQRKRHSSRRMSNIALESPQFRPLDVLICEDHPVSRMVMERLLEKLNCRSMSVENGPDAIRCTMGAVKFDIILMEYKLPDPISGEDVARMIRTSDNPNARTPIVAVTGYLKDLMEPHHFDALLEKPMTLASLTDILERFCNWRAPPSEKEKLERMSPGERRDSISRTRYYDGSGRLSPSVDKFMSPQRRTPLGQVFAYDDDSNADSSEHIVLSRQTTNEWEHLATGRASPRRPVDTAPSLSNVSISSSVQGPPSIVTEESDSGTPAEEEPKLKAITKRAHQLRHDSAQMLSKFWGQGNQEKKQDKGKDKDDRDEIPDKTSDKEEKRKSNETKEKRNSNEAKDKRESLEEKCKSLEREDDTVPEMRSHESHSNPQRRERSRSPEKKPSKAKSIADFVMRAGKRPTPEMKRTKSDRGE